MPSGIGEASTTYLIELEEQLSDGEVVKHKWPVTPFQVRMTNNAAQPCLVEVKVDGKVVPTGPKSKQTLLRPGESHTLDGFEDSRGKRELLFSLPRHLTLQEKQAVERGQKIAPCKGLMDLSSVIVTFKPTDHQPLRTEAAEAEDETGYILRLDGTGQRRGDCAA